MFRPILLLLPCIVLAKTMAIDSEDELEMHLDAMDMEDEMNSDRNLDLDNDFEEDDEEEDRDLLLDDRLGRPTGPIVGCGRSLELLQLPPMPKQITPLLNILVPKMSFKVIN